MRNKRSTEKLIFRKLSRKGFRPRHVAEVGVYSPETSNVYDFIKLGIKCTLVEPNPQSVDWIRQHFSGYKNVTLHPVAVYDHNGREELAQRSASTFVSELANSPAIINDDYRLSDKDRFVVDAKTFDEIDDGTIDLLSVDAEGCEWYVIRHMVSRPAAISLETHGAIYINPYLDRILDWMKVNDYRVWYKDRSDTVFVRNTEIEVSTADKLKLASMTIYLEWRRLRKRLKRRLKQLGAAADAASR